MLNFNVFRDLCSYDALSMALDPSQEAFDRTVFETDDELVRHRCMSIVENLRSVL